MKQISEIDKEIEILNTEMVEVRDDPKALKRLSKKMPRLVLLKRYLETCPTEEFLKKEAKRIKDRIAGINKTYFPPEGNHLAIKAYKKDFEKKWGIKQLNEQKKAIEYLLK